MFSLLHGTDMMLRALQTVKAREGEYTTIKMLSERIKGIPVDFQLASRDRRLVAQGPLLRMHFEDVEEDWDRPDLDYTPIHSAFGFSRSPSWPPPPPRPFASADTTSEWIYAFVFTDVVVLTQHHQTTDHRGGILDSWELLPDVGIARVLGYSDMSSDQRE